MPSIKQASQAYEPSNLHNIADLGEVSVDEDIITETRTDNEGKQYTVNLIKRGKESYRVPFVVLNQIKSILVKKPDLKKFSVAKTGEGLNTTYTVIPF